MPRDALVMVLDDGGGSLGALSMALVRGGVDVVYANDPDELILLAREQPHPSVILLAPNALALRAQTTLSKALGSYGGYVCGSQPVIDLIRNRARPLIYSTGLPPASVAAAIAALDLIAAEPSRAARPLAKARAFTEAAGLPLAESAIVPVVIGEASAALEASRILEQKGGQAVDFRLETKDGKVTLKARSVKS